MNKYYTPEVKDVFVGYQTEKIIHGGGSRDFFPSDSYTEEERYQAKCNWYCDDSWESKEHIITIKDVISVIEFNGDYMCGPGMPIEFLFRTKYLNKEDIESLGWKELDNKYNTSKFPFEKDNYILILHPNKKVEIFVKDLSVYDPSGETTTGTIYLGECPSKNELIKIMKLINIKYESNN